MDAWPPPTPSRKTPVVLGGVAFPSLAAVKRHAQPVIAAAPLDVPILDPVLVDLVRTRHYGVVRAGVTPTHLEKSTAFPHEFAPWSLAVALLDRPGLRPLSYQKCLEPWDFRKEFARALRLRFRARFRPLHLGPACEACGATGVLDLDHFNPSFATIEMLAWNELSAAERDDWLGYDWMRHSEFTLPEHHPAAKLFDALHASATFVTLCPLHHRAVTSARRASA